MDYFNNVLTTFLGFERGSRGAVYGGSESSQISSKILCSEDEQRSYGFKTTWGWVINDRIFIFGWTIPLMSFFLVSIWMSVVYSLSGLIPVSQFWSVALLQAGLMRRCESVFLWFMGWWVQLEFDSWRSEGDVRFLLNYARSAGRESAGPSDGTESSLCHALQTGNCQSLTD